MMNNKFLVGVTLVGVFLIGSFALASGIPKGTYTVKTNDGAIWELTLDGKGKFKVTRNGGDAVGGKYKETKGEIEFTDEEGIYAEKNDSTKTGTYHWKLNDNKIDFTIIKDQAEGRSSTLTAGPWEIKK
jgi:hypothetical protein